MTRTSTPVATRTPVRCPADVNGDGKVTGWDVAIVTRAILGHRYDPRADVDGDGDVDHRDLKIVLKALISGQCGR
jgi:hypothetical protein